MRSKRITLLIPLLLLAIVAGGLLGFAGPGLSTLDSRPFESERQACDRLAPLYHAATEVRLPDGSRVDLLTAHEAIEVDWSRKWCEAVGQSLYYALKTDRCAGIILLLKDPDREDRYVQRCRTVCRTYGIALYTEPAERRQPGAGSREPRAKPAELVTLRE